MNRFARGGIALCAGFCLTLTAIAVAERNPAPPQLPGTKLGPLDMDDYCREAWGDRARAVHPGEGAYGWRCWLTKNELLVPQAIATDEACETMYEPPAYAESFQLDSPFSWVCFRGPRPTP